MTNPQFWQERGRFTALTKELSQLKKEVEEFEELELALDVLKEEKNEESLKNFEKLLRKFEFLSFLSGKYDKKDAVLTIQSGAGGLDAQDWAAMLLRMYERYAQRKGFTFEIWQKSFGEGIGAQGRIGLKSATAVLKGPFAFGILKRESGVHRLVRISPFSAQHLRHTSFALVEVTPLIPEPERKIVLNPDDLKIDFYKASGPGGQYVNKRMTAVRISHKPTGIVVSCQTERSQAQNKKRAMTLLYSKLYNLLSERREEEIKKIKGKKVSPQWGNQIRSYVLHPYKLVKDLRTGIETSQVEDVLDGNLESFIKEEIMLKND